MGMRGPKPADIGTLRFYATEWSFFLYELRDGGPVEVYRVKRSKRFDREDDRWIQQTLYIFVKKFHPASEEARLWLRKPPSGEWHITRPLPEAPEVWEQLKSARSSDDIAKFLAAVEKRKTKEKCTPGNLWHALLHGAREHASELLKARRLPHYPREEGERPSSDNKRIDFWAKVLSGTALGLAPATATKRLSRWLPPIPASSLVKSRRRTS